jgi:hypothetical protein
MAWFALIVYFDTRINPDLGSRKQGHKPNFHTPIFRRTEIRSDDGCTEIVLFKGHEFIGEFALAFETHLEPSI